MSYINPTYGGVRGESARILRALAPIAAASRKAARREQFRTVFYSYVAGAHPEVYRLWRLMVAVEHDQCRLLPADLEAQWRAALALMEADDGA